MNKNWIFKSIMVLTLFISFSVSAQAMSDRKKENVTQQGETISQETPSNDNSSQLNNPNNEQEQEPSDQKTSSDILNSTPPTIENSPDEFNKEIEDHKGEAGDNYGTTTTSY